MKDLPHHMKKLNRRVIRSAHHEHLEEQLPEIPSWPETIKEKKKKAKKAIAKEKKARPPVEKTPEEKNKLLRKRAPIFDRHNAKPKHNAGTKKKTPRI